MLVNFYKQTRQNFSKLQEMIQASLYSETMYEESLKIYHGQKNVNRIQKALATFIVFNQSRFATPEKGWVFDNGSGGSHKAISYRHKTDNFCPWLAQRLRYVQISCRDALAVIEERDTPDTFFYLDPPYFGAYQGHYSGFNKQDLDRLIELLSKIKGRFLLSNYHFPGDAIICEKNNWFIDEISVPRTINNGSRPLGRTEILIRNFPIHQSNQQLTIFD